MSGITKAVKNAQQMKALISLQEKEKCQICV